MHGGKRNELKTKTFLETKNEVRGENSSALGVRTKIHHGVCNVLSRVLEAKRSSKTFRRFGTCSVFRQM